MRTINDYALDSISINNGNTYTTVADLTDSQIQNVICSGISDDDFPGGCHGKNEREWLEDYCAHYLQEHGAPLIIG